MDAIKKIDWKELRQQKRWLAECATNAMDEEMLTHAEGLLSLLDAIMDEAVATGIATDEEVFGPHES